MTTTKALGNRTYTVTTTDDAAFLLFSPPAQIIEAGELWTIEFAPSLDFDGTMVVMARAPGRNAEQNPPAFVPVWYRADYLNGAPVDPTAWQTAPISSASNINIALNGRSVALLCSVAAGTCTLYTNGSQQT